MSSRPPADPSTFDFADHLMAKIEVHAGVTA